mmetsp:Transcript_28552/g.68062  ORF Transcript_28552/g.68062 Transcript_28552/m.68062 type:complete len:913 (+) Transcript_28552:274-3012(+)
MKFSNQSLLALYGRQANAADDVSSPASYMRSTLELTGQDVLVRLLDQLDDPDGSPSPGENSRNPDGSLTPEEYCREALKLTGRSEPSSQCPEETNESAATGQNNSPGNALTVLGGYAKRVIRWLTGSRDEAAQTDAFSDLEPEPEVVLGRFDRSKDYWFMEESQVPKDTIKELRKHKIRNQCQKLLRKTAKNLDQDMTKEQIEESFNRFKKELAELIGRKCPEYADRLNFGQALSELTELLVALHYSPDSSMPYEDGTCRWDKMPLDNNCLEWLLKVLPQALNEEAGGTEMSADLLERVAECVTMVDLRPIIPFSKEECISEFNSVRNDLGLSKGEFDLIGHLFVAFHAKFFQALEKNKDKPLPVLAGSYLVNARMYNESGQVTSFAVRKEGCIAHPECWLAGYIGNSIIYSIEDYVEFGRTLSRAFGHVANVVEGFQVPEESRIGLRYGGLDKKTPAELKNLREVLREMRARLGRKRTRAAEMYSVCMIDGQDHDTAMDTIRNELGDSYANLLQGSFDGGATTGKMISDAFRTYYESIGRDMTHKQAMKKVRYVHGFKHANLVQGSFDGGATTGRMISEAFKAHAKAIEENYSHEEAIEILRRDYSDKHVNLFTSQRKNLKVDELARAKSIIDEYWAKPAKPDYLGLTKYNLAKQLLDDKILEKDLFDAFMLRHEVCSNHEVNGRVPYRCRHSASDGTQCTAIVEAIPGSKPLAFSDFYRFGHTCKYSDGGKQCRAVQKCRAVPGKRKKSNDHWTKTLEDSADASHIKRLEKTMNSTNKISLEDPNVSLFRCKLKDKAGNQCGCCFRARFGTKMPLMSRHNMTAVHTCTEFVHKKNEEEKYRMFSRTGKYKLPEKAEGRLAENDAWEEIPVPKNLKYLAQRKKTGGAAVKAKKEEKKKQKSFYLDGGSGSS